MSETTGSGPATTSTRAVEPQDCGAPYQSGRLFCTMPKGHDGDHAHPLACASERCRVCNRAARDVSASIGSMATRWGA